MAMKQGGLHGGVLAFRPGVGNAPSVVWGVSAALGVATLSGSARGSSVGAVMPWSNSTILVRACVSVSVRGASGALLGVGCFNACTMPCRAVMMMLVEELSGMATLVGYHFVVSQMRMA